ncbi:MAG: hypothetical protein WKF88_05655 [Ferruginibacter sp.]
MIKIDEKHFEDILFGLIQTREGVEKLKARGFDIEYEPFSVYYRQLNMGAYGIPDIVRVFFNSYSINIDVIELKITDFNISQLLQLGRYLSGVNHFIRDAHSLTDSGRIITVRGFLMVAEFDSNNDYSWLSGMLRNEVCLYSTHYNIDGLKFEKQFPGYWSKTDIKTHLNQCVDIAALRNKFKQAYLKKQFTSDDLPF